MNFSTVKENINTYLFFLNKNNSNDKRGRKPQQENEKMTYKNCEVKCFICENHLIVLINDINVARTVIRCTSQNTDEVFYYDFYPKLRFYERIEKVPKLHLDFFAIAGIYHACSPCRDSIRLYYTYCKFFFSVPKI